MTRFVIADPQWCIGCKTCLAACSDVHKTQGLQQQPRLTLVRTPAQTAPVLCRHCEDAPCKQVCPVNAISFQNDSVYLNESLCIGCKLCGLACPFGAITPSGSTPLDAPAQYEYFASHVELSDLPASPASVSPFLRWNAGIQTIAVKCDLCYFLPEGPACIASCATNALFLITESDTQKMLYDRRKNTALMLTDLELEPRLPNQEQR